MSVEEEVKQIGLDLGNISPEVLEIILDDEAPESPFFQEVFLANRDRVEILEVLRSHTGTPDGVREEASQRLQLTVPSQIALDKIRAEKRSRPPEEKKQSLLKTIQQMNVGQKIQLAKRGGRDVRNLLLKDTNKEVLRMVISNPKMTESEVELIAVNRQIPEEILRTVSKNREWMRNYNIVLGLVSNPKTPAGISSNLVARIKKQDLVKLERNKNIPELVRVAVKKSLIKVRKQ